MKYNEQGYNDFLDTGDQEQQITTKNTEAMIGDGVISLDQTSLNKILPKQSVASKNFVTGSTGWQITGEGDVEFNSGTFRGSLVAGSIHIPDENTTANSFHVESDGDAWWGCTQSDFTSDNDNANSYILKTGAAKFQDITVDGGTIIGSSIKTNAATYPYVEMDTSGVTVSGTSAFNVITSGGASCGTLQGYFDSTNTLGLVSSAGALTAISGAAGVLIGSTESGAAISLISADFISLATDSATTNILMHGRVVPTSTSCNIGASSARWGDIWATNVDVTGGMNCDGDINCDDIIGDVFDMVLGQTNSFTIFDNTTLYATINTGGGDFAITTDSNRDMKLVTGSGNVYISAAAIAPLSSGSGSCGASGNYWSDVFTNNVTLSSGKYFNYTGGYIQSNSQFRVVGSVTLTGNLTFENAASITINGRAYYETTGAYDASKYYLRSA